MMQCVKFNGSSCVKHTIYKNIFKEPQRFIVILQQKMLEQCLPFRSFQALKLAPPTARSDTFPAKTNSPGITSFNRRGVVDHFLCNSPLKQHRALEMVNCSFKFSTTGIKAANWQKKILVLHRFAVGSLNVLDQPRHVLCLHWEAQPHVCNLHF